MKIKFCLAVVSAAVALVFAGRAENPPGKAVSNAPEFKNLTDLKWEKIIPDLGENSPEICILHIDPKTHGTSLLIRAPKRFMCASTGTQPMKHTQS